MLNAHRSKFGTVTCLLVALTSLALEVGGCNGVFRPVDWSELAPPQESKPKKSPYRVVSRRNMDVVALTPHDIVRVMKRVGFADELILELGTDLANGLRFSGEAAILYRKETLAVFTARDDSVYIRSRSGNFAYQISQGQFMEFPLERR